MGETKLRVWWNPQLGADCTFYIPVESVEEAKKFLDVLAAYDQFQYQNRIKPDFCNTGGLQMWDEEEKDWVDWSIQPYNSDCVYEDVDKYCEAFDTGELEEFTKAVFSQVSFDN